MFLPGLLLFYSLSAFSQVSFSNPVRITTREGLPDNRVLCIGQDEYGFMWFGTYDGLCRYDGSAVQVFQHVPEDTASLSNNLVKSLFYDKERRQLWIGTIDGLNVLDVLAGNIKRYTHDPEKKNSLPADNISYTIFKDRQGELWISLDKKGLARYHPATDSFEHFIFQPQENEGDKRLHRANYLQDICQDLENDSILWLGTQYGLLRFNKYTGRFRHYYNDSLEKRLQASGNIVRGIYPLTDGRLLLGAWGNFLVIFDPSDSSFTSILATLQPERFPAGEGLVYQILRKSETEVWASTREGLVVFDLEREQVVSERLHDPATDTYYRATFMDKDGRLWARFRHGVEYHDPLHEQFRYFPLPPDQENAGWILHDAVQAPGKDKLFVTIVQGEGLYQLDRRTGEWSVLLPPAGFRNGPRPLAWRDLIYLQDGTLLIVEENTLFTLSEDGTRIVPFSLQPPLEEPRYMSALQDSESRIWLTSINSSLIRLNPEDGSIYLFDEEFLEPGEQEKKILIRTVFEDRFQNLWFAVSNGLSTFDHRQGRFHNFRHRPGRTNTFNHIVSFAEDDQGRILIAGGENGIGIADPRQPEKGIIGKLDLNTGQPVRPNSLLKDTNGDLWYKDDKNLKRIDLEDGTLAHFDGYNGLAADEKDREFVPINGVKFLPSGEIAVLYQQGKGLSIFHPDSLRQNEALPQPYLTSFAVFDQELASDTALFFRREITLPYHQNFFSFEFSAIGFTQAHQHQFRYRLEGLDRNWIYPAGGRRYASYSKVWEGDYTLQIMAANNEGAWNPEPYTLKIRILPPWYRSWWAYVLYVATLAGISWVIYRFLKRRWALQLQLQTEQAEARRFKELDEFKTRFYTNITHEFRTPLTVIYGLADQIKDKPRSKIGHYAGLIKSNSRRLLELINQLLDLSRLEAGKLQPDYVQGDIILYLAYLIESFHSLTLHYQVTLSFYSHTDRLVMDYDPEKCRQVIANLVSNAVKFTPQYGKVTVVAREVTENNARRWLEVSVRDTGAGIPPEKLPFIFDRFYQVDDSSVRQGEGTGLGLALVKELLTLMDGSIEVESEVGKGSRFTFRLPVRREAEKQATALPALETPPLPETALPAAGTNSEAAAADDLPLVLVVEDNRDVTYYLRSCLEGRYQILEARNGREGIDRALEAIPDLVITDVMMPEVDGFELCRTLKTDERTSHIPILMLTARAGQSDKIEGLTTGADAYLVKPFNQEELLLRLDNFLQMRARLQTHLQSGPADGPPTPEQQFLQRINDIIRAHLDETDFTIHHLAREAGLSRSQLYRKVNALTGQSLSRYVRSYRLQEARRLLLSTDLPVSEVAWATGFNSLSWFNQAYQEEFDENPSATRK